MKQIEKPHPIERLRYRLAAQFPKATLTTDQEDESVGSWFLNIGIKGITIIVQNFGADGFGINIKRPGGSVYGDTQRSAINVELAFEKVCELIQKELGQF